MAEENIEDKPPLDLASGPAAGKSENEAEGKEEAPAAQKTGRGLFNIPALIVKLRGGGKRSPADPKPAPEAKRSAVATALTLNVQKINLKSVNQALIFILIGLVVLMFYVTFRKKQEISSVTAAVSKIKFLDVNPKVVMAFGEVTYYLDQIKNRDIFSAFVEKKPPPPVVKPQEPKEPPPPPKVPIESKAKDLELTGISWGNNPKAIIRNRSDQNVYFVGEGETIEGTELKVKEIFKDEVIITLEGDEMSLL